MLSRFSYIRLDVPQIQIIQRNTIGDHFSTFEQVVENIPQKKIPYNYVQHKYDDNNEKNKKAHRGKS